MTADSFCQLIQFARRNTCKVKIIGCVNWILREWQEESQITILLFRGKKKLITSIYSEDLILFRKNSKNISCVGDVSNKIIIIIIIIIINACLYLGLTHVISMETFLWFLINIFEMFFHNWLIKVFSFYVSLQKNLAKSFTYILKKKKNWVSYNILITIVLNSYILIINFDVYP